MANEMNIARIGVTATRKGITDEQSQALKDVFNLLASTYGRTEFHHGCCVGGDAEVAGIYRRWWPNRANLVYAYPANDVDDKWISSTPVWDYKAKPMPALRRNSLMINRVYAGPFDGYFLCLPGESIPKQRSGTWSTIRKLEGAEYMSPHLLIYPNGHIRARQCEMHPLIFARWGLLRGQ